MTDASRYYDGEACRSCAEVQAHGPAWAVYSLLIALAALCAMTSLWTVFGKVTNLRAARLQHGLNRGRLWMLQMGFVPKAKQFISFYQIVSRVQRTYGVDYLPQHVVSFMNALDIIGLNLGSLGPSLLCCIHCALSLCIVLQLLRWPESTLLYCTILYSAM